MVWPVHVHARGVTCISSMDNTNEGLGSIKSGLFITINITASCMIKPLIIFMIMQLYMHAQHHACNMERDAWLHNVKLAFY